MSVVGELLVQGNTVEMETRAGRHAKAAAMVHGRPRVAPSTGPTYSLTPLSLTTWVLHICMNHHGSLWIAEFSTLSCESGEY